MSESPKRSMSMGSPSPTREQKARLAVAEATASANNMQGKWKMQIGAATSGSSRFKKKPEREDWCDDREPEKRNSKNGDGEPRKGRGGSVEKNMSVRKAMAMKEQPKKPPEPEPIKKIKPPPPTTAPKPIIPPGPVVLDKFGNFRLMTPPKDTSKLHGDDMPPLPPGGPPKNSFAGKNFTKM